MCLLGSELPYIILVYHPIKMSIIYFTILTFYFISRAWQNRVIGLNLRRSWPHAKHLKWLFCFFICSMSRVQLIFLFKENWRISYKLFFTPELLLCVLRININEFPLTAIIQTNIHFVLSLTHPWTAWNMKCISFFKSSSLSGLSASPFPPCPHPCFPPPLVESFHMWAVVTWRMPTFERACHAQREARLGKMEGGLVSHATQLVAKLTLCMLVCCCCYIR